jgi:cytochrome c oxidase subunit IV
MGSSHHHDSESSNIAVQPRDSKKIKQILKVTYILGAVTAVEFLCAGIFQRGFALTTLFVLLTFVKTFYIVGEFMHLKYEVKTLIWSIVIPTLFIMWLILSLLMEGSSVFDFRAAIFGN